MQRTMAKRNSRGPPRTPKKFPTATGGIARLAYEQAKTMGTDVTRFLNHAKLTLKQVTDDRIRVPVKAQIEFLSLVANALQNEFLGIRLAQTVDLREIGLLYYVLASSEKLNDALHRVSRYSGINNEGVRIIYHQHKGSLTFQHVGIARLSDHHQVEFFVTILLRACRHIAGRHLMPESIRFIHRRTRLPSDLRSFFGCDVSFGNKADEISFSKNALHFAVVRADPYLNSLLEKLCQETISERRAISSDWRLQVENALARLLPHGQGRMSEVCRELGVSSRTLSRRLTSEGYTFAEVVDELRRDLANRYLREPELTISKIAWLLGYRQTSSFDHAFKRWTGQIPSRVRARTRHRSRSQSPR
jgi:AraC-like DNA-binding protein